jgi:hypothetical protein
MAGKGVWRNITGGKIGEGKLGRGIGEQMRREIKNETKISI